MAAMLIDKVLPGRAGGRVKGSVRRHEERSSTLRLEVLDDYESAGLGWLWATDASGNLIYLSAGAGGKLGKEPEELLGQALVSIFLADDDDDRARSERPLSFLLGTHTPIKNLVVRDLFESKLWWSLSGRPKFDSSGEFIGYRGSLNEVTAEYQQQKDASRLSQYDSLTGLANRHRMNQRLDSILAAFRASERSCALMMLDLDRFKHVNDTLGHPAGDELLKQVAQRLKRVVSGAGVEIGRLGGDEFQIILPDNDDRGDLGETAGRIVQMLSQPYSIHGVRAVIGASVGIAVSPHDGADSDSFTKNADLALYAAKGEGRGRFRFYSNQLKERADEQRAIEEDLRDAVAKGELHLEYQPIVRTFDHLVVGFEALLRWNHPARGMINPALFIPVAEESGLIVRIGEWALRQACHDAALWPGRARVAVNVSATQFSTDGLAAMVANSLAASELDPARLELEITESVFMGDAASTDRMFKSLKRLGVRLALDDFGTGYSSLSYLREAPFDKIKIDQCFVRGCTNAGNPNSAIIAAIVRLAEALGMETTAEGIEAMDELQHLQERGATSLQGFIYSASMTHREVMEKLADGDLRLQPVGPEKYRPERQSMYRIVGVIHDDYRYEVLLRNLSVGGALIEGLLDVPLGTEVVVDLGEGQLAVATVSRSSGAEQGVEFEVPLVSDGSGGLVTRYRISPDRIVAAGMPLSSLANGKRNGPPEESRGRPRFMRVDLSDRQAFPA